ncbi:MAG: hypothetical protein H9901_01365 [Candidatus Paralactobacillus gallistercoris]|uniref:Uncharacterized protein n=1 Tax=Candidatus Paralactobacillus gallistercoris TaxID=2838724 RepID=A0A948TJC1_9LACO|nr:hypothetical protein [Candidatus Paralactobacillus gallistercoris]
MTSKVSQLTFTEQWSMWLFILGTLLFVVGVLWWLIAWLFKRQRTGAKKLTLVAFIAVIVAIITVGFFGG